MTQTIQSRSGVSLKEADMDLNKNKPETETNKNLLIHIFDSLNNLYEKLNRLDYLIQRKNIKQILYPSDIHDNGQPAKQSQSAGDGGG
jgi:hypothetical protein